MSVIVIGKSSFIATTLAQIAPPTWRFLSHSEALADTGWIANATLIINCAFSPQLRTQGYIEAEDIDSKIAHNIAAKNIHYIMLSSRMVYGKPNGGIKLHEGDDTQPVNMYGASKLRVEQSLATILNADQLTIVRLSNVFGIEHGRRSFFGMAQTNLVAHNRIIYDMSPLTQRDFIAVWRVADALRIIAENPKAGIYHLGAGFSIETGLIAEWLIEAYGSGELLVTKFSHADQFFLDMQKTRAEFTIPTITVADVKTDILQCGAALIPLKKVS